MYLSAPKTLVPIGTMQNHMDKQLDDKHVGCAWRGLRLNVDSKIVLCRFHIDIRNNGHDKVSPSLLPRPGIVLRSSLTNHPSKKNIARIDDTRKMFR